MPLVQFPELEQFLYCFPESRHRSSPEAVAVTEVVGDMPLPSEGPPGIPQSKLRVPDVSHFRPQGVQFHYLEPLTFLQRGNGGSHDVEAAEMESHQR